MGSPLGLPCIFNHLLHGQIVLYAPIDSRQESLLHGRVLKVVLELEGGEALVDQDMEGFSDTPTESNHPKIGGI